MNINDNIKRLEQIAQELDNDNNLHKSMKLFEEGVGLLKDSYEYINSASGKITVLKKELDKYTEKDFDDIDA